MPGKDTPMVVRLANPGSLRSTIYKTVIAGIGIGTAITCTAFKRADIAVASGMLTMGFAYAARSAFLEAKYQDYYEQHLYVEGNQLHFKILDPDLEEPFVHLAFQLASLIASPLANNELFITDGTQIANNMQMGVTMGSYFRFTQQQRDMIVNRLNTINAYFMTYGSPKTAHINDSPAATV